MKKLLLISVLFFSFSGKAQMCCPPGSEWYHDIYNPIYSNPNANGFIRFKYINDQFVGGKTQKVIEERFFGTLYSNPPIPFNNYFKDVYFFREENGVIYLNNDTALNFNATIGDKWRQPILKDANLNTDPYCNGPRGYFQVIDTSHIIINNTNLKRLTLNSFNYYLSPSTVTPVVYSLTVTERIDLSLIAYWAKSCPIEPPPTVLHGQWGAGLLQCYKDSTSFGSYSVFSPTFNCVYDFTIGLKEHSKLSLLNIYPNPTKDKVTISLSELDLRNSNSIKKLYIVNALDQLYLSKDINSSTLLNIDLSNLPKGIYFLKLVDEDLRSFTSKIVLE
jgi:hypothetical protein